MKLLVTGSRVIREMVETFVKKHVARSAAALSYYLTISVFPFLVCLSAILGSIHVQRLDMVVIMSEILPADISSVLAGFFDRIGGVSIELLLGVGLAALLTSSSAAFRSFTGIIGEIQGKRRYGGVWGGVLSFVFSIALIVAIYISGFIILTGEWLMQILETSFGIGNVLALWSRVRFVILFLLLFAFIYGVYIGSAPKETKRTHRLPGALCASVVLVVASVIYSRIITASIRYELLYGSIASFIIIMIWLYTCGLILIMGNVFNVSLNKVMQSLIARDQGDKG